MPAAQGIWYNARGSAAGSLVAYALEITLVEPLSHGLLFERFLNSKPHLNARYRPGFPGRSPG